MPKSFEKDLEQEIKRYIKYLPNRVKRILEKEDGKITSSEKLLLRHYGFKI
jgi:hypothetical protein